MVNTYKKYIVLSIEILIIVGLTFSSWLIPYISILSLRLIVRIILNLLIGLSGYIAIKMSNIEIDFEWKKYKQFIIGALIAFGLSIIIAWIPALCGFSLVGNHMDFVWWEFFYNLFFYLLIVGPVEELVFRVYFQKTFVNMFSKNRWIGVIIASALFGLWHLINGSILQVLFTFGIGLVFGLTKEYIKDLHYPGIALSHGLYDFLNYIVTLTIA